MHTSQLIDNIAGWIYYCTLATAVICAVLRFKKLDKGGKYICALIWLAALSEFFSWVASIKFKNNILVYEISNILELGLISLYFNSTIRKFRKHNIGIIIAVTGAILGIINMVFFQPTDKFNATFVFMECVVVVCLCLFLIFRMLVADEDIELGKEFHFWITCTLLFNQCTSLGNWGILNYVAQFFPKKLISWDISIILINILTYTSLIVLFYRFPKLRKTNV